MDRVTESLVKDFLESEGMKSKTESEDFEKFATFCVMSKEYSETFDIDDVCVGESPGIDGLGIIVNGCLVNSTEEVDDLKERNKYVEVKFVFIQSKTSEKFEGSEVGSFGNAVLDTFSKKPSLSHNEVMLQKIKIINHIFDNFTAAMTKGLPVCKLYYVTTGKWREDKNLKSRFNTVRLDLTNTNYFAEVTCEPLGAQEIQKLYMATKMAVTTEVTLQHKVSLPRDINGVDQAFVGVVPFEEFKKIIMDDTGNIRPVFYDNIRDFQGENKVNRDIQETIKSNRIERFAVLNNGVTIVAKKLTMVGNKATLHDYQIVNGCQTSHVIYNNANVVQLAGSLWIPVKIISTQDDEVVNDIIKATNNQTEVKPEQLAALSQFQKDLENYYKSYKGENELYYERRSKQYANQTGINKTKIITIPIQIKAFAAMFLGLPHRVSRYYGTIVQDIGGGIFSPEHRHISYYTSALCYYKLEGLFRTGDVDSKYKKCRFHVLFAFARHVAGCELPPLNSKKIDDYCEKLIDELSGERCLQEFKQTIELIDKLGIDITNRDHFKIQTTTDNLNKLVMEAKEGSETTSGVKHIGH